MLEISDFTSVLERIVDRQSVVEIEDTSQAPSSGLAATFFPDDRGEGTGIPILQAAARATERDGQECPS